MKGGAREAEGRQTVHDEETAGQVAGLRCTRIRKRYRCSIELATGPADAVLHSKIGKNALLGNAL